MSISLRGRRPLPPGGGLMLRSTASTNSSHDPKYGGTDGSLIVHLLMSARGFRREPRHNNFRWVGCPRAYRRVAYRNPNHILLSNRTELSDHLVPVSKW